MVERIVLFGGTFNPIHHGHLIVARAIAEYYHFEKVTFVPAAVPPHKELSPGQASPQVPAGRLPSPEERLEMVRLAIAAEGLFDVSDIELRRRPPSYTIETLLAVRQRHGLEAQLHWIIGADMLEDLPTWRRADEVVEMCRIITAARPPWSSRLEQTLQKLRVRFSAEQVARLAAGVTPSPLIDITSTQIRHRVRQGRSIRFLTPEAVVEYIREKGLYRPC
ncbi:MAG: nicotinate (nicotinamide) nucleotide adenylyltransferase [Planctomycetales bacterium 4484_123]|nr:MAG: nicotinate (nicotinamide) nucleotide adenylyltransferase [Planctomycetales bacterium 4484_123]